MRTAGKNDTIGLAVSLQGLPAVSDPLAVPKTEAECRALELRAMLGDQKAAETYKKFNEAVDRAEAKRQDPAKAMEEAAKELARTTGQDGDPLSRELKRKRTDFTQRAEELAEKRLELAEIEKRYDEAK
jgi:hypothetical protein